MAWTNSRKVIMGVSIREKTTKGLIAGLEAADDSRPGVLAGGGTRH
jgi:hypothetical protein